MLYLHSVLRDFIIQPIGPVSALALKFQLNTFQEVCDHLLHLPYRRPFGKTPTAVLEEGCGTCSSKHGLLKTLAEEQGQGEVELVLCLFQMTSANTQGISKVLDNGPLSSIPELHTYIRWGDEKIDVTKPGFHVSNLQSGIGKEKTISLKELARKKEIHQEWMSDWLRINRSDVLLADAWQQREACIEALVQT